MAGAAQIRIAGPEDAAAIATVHCQAWRETYRGMLPDAMVDGLGPEEAETKWALRLAPESSDEVFLATDRAGTPLGFASGKPSDEPTAPDAGLLDTLYLLRAGQGLGLGGRLRDHDRRRPCRQSGGRILRRHGRGAPAGARAVVPRPPLPGDPLSLAVAAICFARCLT